MTSDKISFIIYLKNVNLYPNTRDYDLDSVLNCLVHHHKNDLVTIYLVGNEAVKIVDEANIDHLSKIKIMKLVEGLQLVKKSPITKDHLRDHFEKIYQNYIGKEVIYVNF